MSQKKLFEDLLDHKYGVKASECTKQMMGWQGWQSVVLILHRENTFHPDTLGKRKGFLVLIETYLCPVSHF